MSDKTPAQREADEAIRAALDLHNEAYRARDSQMQHGVLVDWVITYVAKGFLDDGGSATRYVTEMSEGTAWHSALGLLRMARMEIESQYEDEEFI